MQWTLKFFNQISKSSRAHVPKSHPPFTFALTFPTAWTPKPSAAIQMIYNRMYNPIKVIYYATGLFSKGTRQFPWHKKRRIIQYTITSLLLLLLLLLEFSQWPSSSSVASTRPDQQSISPRGNFWTNWKLPCAKTASRSSDNFSLPKHGRGKKQQQLQKRYFNGNRTLAATATAVDNHKF